MKIFEILLQADGEYKNTVRVYDLEEGPKDHTERLATASKYRKQIEDTFKGMSGANDELAKLLEEDKKDELATEVIYPCHMLLFHYHATLTFSVVSIL